MTNTLKIAIVAVVLLAAGAVATVIIITLRPDPQADKFFAVKGEITKFLASSAKPKKNESPDSPLVRQAEIFALRIDPPQPKPMIQTKTHTRPGIVPAISPKRQPTTRFSLAGTVVSPDPTFSMAMIKTTAKGVRWLRPGEKIGRSTIKRIYRDKIVIDDGKKTYEMNVPKKNRISLLKGDPDNPYTNQKRNPYKGIKKAAALNYQPQINPLARPSVSGNAGSSNRIRQDQTVIPQPTEEMMKENMEFLLKIANDPESMGMSKQEADQIGDMSQLIGALEKDLAKARKNKAKEKLAEKKLRRIHKRTKK